MALGNVHFLWVNTAENRIWSITSTESLAWSFIYSLPDRAGADPCVSGGWTWHARMAFFLPCQISLPIYPYHLVFCKLQFKRGRVTVISTVTGGSKNFGSVPGRKRIFPSSSQTSDWFWRPLSVLFNGCQGLHPREIKRQGRDASHSLPSSAEVKNEWSYTSTSSLCLYIVYRDAFTFTLPLI
jgi:hypothetical protein